MRIILSTQFVLLLISTLLAAPVIAEISFSEMIPISGVTNGATAAIGADVDGDGDLDVVCSAYSSSIIAWYENLDGEGSFGTANLITTGFLGAHDVDCADVDGDGDLDVMAVARVTDEVSWFENTDGLGTFSIEHVVSQSCFNVEQVYARDINGDSYIDILYRDGSLNAEIGYYRNLDGYGNFDNPRPIDNNPLFCRSMISPDIDLDGDPDIIIASTFSWDDDYSEIQLLENLDGAGTYATHMSFTSASYTWIPSLLAEDLDLDGDVDVVVTQRDDLYVYDHQEPGNTYTEYFIEGSTNTDISSICCVDLDTDNDLDIIASFNNALYSYTNQTGNNDFSTRQLVATNAGLGSRLHACDLNGDGIDDVLAAEEFSNVIAWYETIALGQGLATKNVISETTIDPVKVITADMNGDGYDDIIAAMQLDSRIVWFENDNGTGAFKHQQTIDGFSSEVTDIYPADIDNDGDIDLIAGERVTGLIAYHENLANTGEFEKHIVTTVPTYREMVPVCATDIDGDGDQDIVTISSINGIAWCPNLNGSGTFGNQIQISSLDWSTVEITACDIDNDGDQDLFVASTADDIIEWYENTDGTGQFGDPQIITTEIRDPRCIYTADIDGDGDQDVLAAAYTEDIVCWFANLDGAGSFSTMRIIKADLHGAYDLACADLDNDGDLDVVSAAKIADWISWHENVDGQGNFGAWHIFGYPEQTQTVACADFDLDGDMDVVGASRLDDRIEWYRNELSVKVDDNPSTTAHPSEFALRGIYPNPFNPTTTVHVDLPAPAELTVSVFNTLGQRVALLSDGPANAGSHTFVFNASELASGIYFVQATVPGKMNAVRKIVFMK